MRLIVVQNRKQNIRGVSLIEVMISLVILLFIFMGLLQTSLLTMDTNVSNELRDEGVRIGSERLAQLRSVAFSDARLTKTYDKPAAPVFVADPAGNELRGFRSRPIPVTFGVQLAIADLDANSKEVAIRISWVHAGDNPTHTLNAVVKR